ncbi:CASP-like protein 4D1 [Coffea arabica]|uniref:CASP-like protein n=1 Tax=Coffea arabica TaxID=13443 RepID=A0A6P6WJL0_COFAR|nr:CASP-like protein 4D1 [Coffea arabica]
MEPPSSAGSPPPSTPPPPPSTTTASPSSATANPPQSSARPAPFTVTCTAGLPVIALVLRLLTFVFLLISLIITAIDTVTYVDDFGLEIKVDFSDLYAYRYMLSTTVIGITYTLLQTAFAIFQVSTGKRFGGAALCYLDFYGDKVISYMLATGAAAGFGITVDFNRLLLKGTDASDFLNKANAAAGLLIVAFLFSAISSVFSSLALPKRA